MQSAEGTEEIAEVEENQIGQEIDHNDLKQKKKSENLASKLLRQILKLQIYFFKVTGRQLSDIVSMGVLEEMGQAILDLSLVIRTNQQKLIWMVKGKFTVICGTDRDGRNVEVTSVGQIDDFLSRYGKIVRTEIVIGYKNDCN